VNRAVADAPGAAQHQRIGSRKHVQQSAAAQMALALNGRDRDQVLTRLVEMLALREKD
jgi:hypothetical protein